MNEQRFQALERIHHLLSGESNLSDREISAELAKCGAILEADTLQDRRSRGIADIPKEKGGRKKGVPLTEEQKEKGRRNKSKNSFITKEFLEEQYALGKNNFAIAHEFGVGSPSTVAWYSKKLGAVNPFYHIGKVKK